MGSVVEPKLHLSDVLDQKRSAASVLGDGADLKGFFMQAPVALMVVDRNLRCISNNEAMAQLLNLPQSALNGRPVSESLPGISKAILHAFNAYSSGDQIRGSEIEYGSKRYELKVAPVVSTMGEIGAVAVAAIDVTRRARVESVLRRSQQTLLKYACHDHLTGLLNRRGLDAKLRRELRRAYRHQSPIAIFMADIDWFKLYNDRYGHLAGDECLCEVAETFKHSLPRVGDEVGRYGGEEFLAILPDMSGTSARMIAEDCRQAIADMRIPHVDSQHGVVTASIGVVVLDPTDEHAQRHRHLQVLQAADEALYAAKANGRNLVVFQPVVGLAEDREDHPLGFFNRMGANLPMA